MSDTDDTDDLLFIPPDFFLVHSEPEPPYYSIVDNLIRQVSNLQDRIEGIESLSDVSLVNSFLDHIPDTINTSMFNSKNSSAKRYYSHDDLYQQTSSQNTPQKLQEKFRLNSLPNTPSVNRFSPRKNTVKFSSPQRSISNSTHKKTGGDESEVLQEIDTFISNVKTIQRNHAVRNLQTDFNNVRTNIPSNFNNFKGTKANSQSCNKQYEETIEELDRQSQKIATERGEIEKRDSDVQERVDRVNAWQCGENIGSVPDYEAGLRDHLYKQKEAKEVPVKMGHLKSNYHQGSTTTDFNSTITLDKSTDSSSEPTQLTALNRSKRLDEFNKFDQKLGQLQNKHKIDEQFYDVFKKKNIDNFSAESVDQERNELLQSPLHDNALSVLNMHKKLLESTNDAVKDGRIHKKRGINTISDTLGLLSLADIWGSGHISLSPTKLSQKLQEEKLRRQHCEQLIQELQNRNLEMQQKLAVAVKVDDTKNKTIQQFKEALDTVSSRMERLNDEKSTWEREMAMLKNQHSIETESANQKVSYYEKEASKSLNLAHGNQEKISMLEKRCSEFQLELHHIEANFKEVQKSYEKEFEKNKQLADILSQKEIELKENKSVMNNAREEVSHSRKAVEICQTEFTALKNECTRLQSEQKEDKNSIISLNELKRKLVNDIQTCKQNEKTLKEALEQSKLKLENTKVELRNFYQGQLEIIVENKRKEMQSQLDRERQNNLEEIKRKELSMAKTAANHIKEMSEKCALENRLLEQKHQEEIKLYQMQLSQALKEVESLQSKLANLPEKRAQIAKQLQKKFERANSHPSKAFHTLAETDHHQGQRKETNFESVSDYDETPVSSRGAMQSESEIQKYINMLLNRPPGNPMADSQEPKSSQNQQRPPWNPGDLEKQSRYYEYSGMRQSSQDRRCGKPPWK